MRLLNKNRLFSLFLVVLATVLFFVISNHLVYAQVATTCGVKSDGSIYCTDASGASAPIPTDTAQLTSLLSNFCTQHLDATGCTTDQFCNNYPDVSTCQQTNHTSDKLGAVGSKILKQLPSADAMGCAVGAVGGTFLGNPAALVSGSICTVVKVVDSLLAPVATVFDALIKFNNQIFTVVFIQDLWTIVRNFVNLFFILIMIVIAFATIFDLQKYNWQSLLARLIIVALLVNFSFVIVETVSNTSDLISSNLLNSIQSTKVGDKTPTISEWLTAGFNPQKLIVEDKTWYQSATEFGSSALATAIGTRIPKDVVHLIFSGLILLTFITLVIMYLARIFVLWGLAILAPAAFVAAILPSTRTHFENWKKHLIAWTLFSPLYLMVIAVTVGFATHRNQILASLGPTFNDPGFFMGLLGLGDILFYSLTLALLWFGLAAVRKVGHFTNTGVNTAFDAIQGKVKRITGVSATQTAVLATKDRFLNEGLPGRFNKLYGGKQGEQRRADKIGMVLQKGLGYRVTDQEKKRVSEEEKKLRIAVENRTSQEKEAYLRQKMQNGSKWEQKAAGNILNTDKKLTDENDQIQHYRNLGGDTSQEARDYITKVELKNWSKEMLRRVDDETHDADVKRALRLGQAQAKYLVNESAQTITSMATVYSSMKDQSNFLATVWQNNNKTAAAQAAVNLKTLRDANGNIVTTTIEADKILAGIAGNLKKQQRYAAMGKAMGSQFNIPAQGGGQPQGGQQGGGQPQGRQPQGGQQGGGQQGNP